jgi:hypothetical protein
MLRRVTISGFVLKVPFILPFTLESLSLSNIVITSSSVMSVFTATAAAFWVHQVVDGANFCCQGLVGNVPFDPWSEGVLLAPFGIVGDALAWHPKAMAKSGAPTSNSLSRLGSRRRTHGQ